MIRPEWDRNKDRPKRSKDRLKDQFKRAPVTMRLECDRNKVARNRTKRITLSALSRTKR